MTDILSQDATDILARLHDGTLTCEALMQATLERIAAVNRSLNAITSLRPADDLMAEARAADAMARKGPLHGLPIAVKDLANVAGVPTSMGSPIFAGQVAKTTDLHIQRMLDAGAIVIGKTNTPEFGLGSHSYNPVFGVTHNALHHGLSAGGSSGGAAVALASHMTALADGSDMMGSLRNPAGWNGVYGMRPTWGVVPSEPDADSFVHLLSTNGPMARSPRDIALLLSVQSGPDPRQTLGGVAFENVSLDADLAGRRIGWLGDWGGAYPMESGVFGHCKSQTDRLAALGCIIEDVAPPFDAAELWDSWITLRSWAITGLGPVMDAHPDALKPEAVWEITRGRKLTNAQITRASSIRSDWMRAAARLFETYDALVLPTAQCWPFPAHLDWPKEIAGTKMDTYHRWMEVVIPASLIGLPCLAVPCEPGPTGLPIGLQLIARPRDDLQLLQLGQGWHRQSL